MLSLSVTSKYKVIRGNESVSGLEILITLLVCAPAVVVAHNKLKQIRNPFKKPIFERGINILYLSHCTKTCSEIDLLFY